MKPAPPALAIFEASCAAINLSADTEAPEGVPHRVPQEMTLSCRTVHTSRTQAENFIGA
ncbi:hypothetical protein [Streptomyces celluloflavus]|uniref:hypothetical protein n=1 Tax=Streptomyces celluloflavus TaxID=58344 RepID=UPI0036829B04